MNKTVLMLMGKSGSGKSTLERRLVEDYPDEFHKVVSLTTRPMREGEVDGVDYKFIDLAEFEEYDFYDEFIQQTHFAGNHYGSLYSDYTTEHPYAILVVVPSSAATFKEVLEEKMPSADVKIIYFDISDDKLRENMLRRGDTPEMIEERLAKDDLDKQFELSGLKADIVVIDWMLDDNLPDRIHTMLYVDRVMNNG